MSAKEVDAPGGCYYGLYDAWIPLLLRVLLRVLLLVRRQPGFSTFALEGCCVEETDTKGCSIFLQNTGRSITTYSTLDCIACGSTIRIQTTAIASATTDYYDPYTDFLSTDIDVMFPSLLPVRLLVCADFVLELQMVEEEEDPESYFVPDDEEPIVVIEENVDCNDVRRKVATTGTTTRKDYYSKTHGLL